MNKRIITKGMSTNGRSGVQVITGLPEPPEGTPWWILQGKAVVRGEVDRVVIIEVVPTTDDTWVVILDDAVPVVGCKIICKEDLQSSRYITILQCEDGAVWREYGYKGRSSRCHRLAAGKAAALEPFEVLEIEEALGRDTIIVSDNADEIAEFKRLGKLRDDTKVITHEEARNYNLLKGKIVYGNIPYLLARYANVVITLEPDVGGPYLARHRVVPAG